MILKKYDGRTEWKFALYNSIEELAKDYGKHPGEKYYELEELDQEFLKLSVVEALENQNKNVN
jgi:hypothetical protein